MHRERPILCLVTDRRRLIADGESVEAAVVQLANVAREAVDAGIDLIQIRERDLSTSALVDLVGTIVNLARDSLTRVVVNDRVDVALAGGAHGVHLRADSIAPSAARSIVPSRFLIGRSVHSPGEAAEVARGTDYLVAGTVFPSASKPSADPLLGVEGLGAIVRAVSVPVLAIGGITVDRVPQIAASGASGVAAIGLFVTSHRRLSRVVNEVRAQFDRVKAPS